MAQSGGKAELGVRPRRTAGRPPGGSEEAFQARRLEILREAAKLFNEQGFHLSSLSDLADRLSVTKPSIYYYVASKDALLFECSRIALERLVLAFEAAMPKPDGLARVTTFFRHYAEIIADDFGRCLVLTDPRSFEPETRKTTSQGRRELNRQVARFITQGIEDGSIVACDARLVTNSLFAMFNGLARWWRPGRDPALGETVCTLLTVVVNGISPRPASRPGLQEQG